LCKLQISHSDLLVQHHRRAFSALAETAGIFAKRAAASMNKINGYRGARSGGIAILAQGKPLFVQQQIVWYALHGFPFIDRHT